MHTEDLTLTSTDSLQTQTSTHEALSSNCLRSPAARVTFIFIRRLRRSVHRFRSVFFLKWQPLEFGRSVTQVRSRFESFPQRV